MSWQDRDSRRSEEFHWAETRLLSASGNASQHLQGVSFESGIERLSICRKRGVVLKENSLKHSSGSLSLLSLINRSDFASSNSVLYTLIDGAKFAGFKALNLPSDGSIEVYSLLDESAQVDATYAGPLLVMHVRGANCPMLKKLLNTAQSSLFLSLIVSDAPLSKLLMSLTNLTEVVHDDETEWVMRYYDPLILPHWLEILHPDQREIALAGIVAWLYIDASGEPKSIAYPDARGRLSSDSEPMRLNQSQCDNLMHRAMPFMIMYQLQTDDPQALEAVPCDERYQFLAQQLEKAQAYRLASVTDMKSYCMLSLMFGSEFDTVPFVASVLQSETRAMSFSDVILTWTSEHWDLLDKRFTNHKVN